MGRVDNSDVRPAVVYGVLPRILMRHEAFSVYGLEKSDEGAQSIQFALRNITLVLCRKQSALGVRYCFAEYSCY